jgi:hypothetical protein
MTRLPVRMRVTFLGMMMVVAIPDWRHGFEYRLQPAREDAQPAQDFFRGPRFREADATF